MKKYNAVQMRKIRINAGFLFSFETKVNLNDVIVQKGLLS
jgi:hypothetical protein